MAKDTAKWYVDYQAHSSLAIDDRGLAYGDGVFETLLVSFGRIQLASYHKERLLRSTRRLTLNFSSEQIDQVFNFIVTNSDNTQSSQAVKVIITRGSGGRGYLPPERPDLTVAVGFFTYQVNANLAEKGVSISVSQVMSGINRSLAGIKHLNRLENVLAKQSLEKNFYEAIMLDEDGFVVECIQSNVFWISKGCLFTPLLNRSGVQGTLRSQIINEFTGSIISVGQYTLDSISNADEVFICNSLTGVIPVIELQGHKKYLIGENTRFLQQQINVQH